jgi:hypothetical protein
VLVAAGVGTFAALVLAEGLVRAFLDEPVQPRFVIDGGFGVRANRPGVSTRHVVPGAYAVAIHTNSAGTRGRREYSLERVPGVRRVLVLGDSFAFGYGVEDGEVVSAVLEELLGRALGTPAEVLNLAVSGFGQAEELLTWRHLGRRYAPDVVVLLTFENDVGNNLVSGLFELGPAGELVRTGRSYLPGSRLQERLLAFAPTRWLFEHSQAGNLVRRLLSARVQRVKLDEQGLTSFRDTTAEALALTRGLLVELVREVRAAGATPVLVIVPDGRTLGSNFPLAACELAELGAGLVDGRELLRTEDYYPRDSHWRPSAHRKVA